MSVAAKDQPQWIDIPPLPLPEGEPAFLSLLLVAFMVLLMTGIILYLANRPVPRAKRQLKRLLTEPLQPREQLTIMHGILLKILGSRCLSDYRFNTKFQPGWQSFCDDLKRCRYQADEPTDREVERLVKDAQDWIGRR